MAIVCLSAVPVVNCPTPNYRTVKMRCIVTGFVAIAFIFCSFPVTAQYILNGNATQNSCNCYTLTQPLNNQFGSVWNSNKINLNTPFDFVFNVYLGCLDGDGADGIVFILQPISTSIGTSGGGMGFQGISPSVGIALDTWQNFEYNDPAFDHLSIQVNGNINHLSDVVPLVPASAVNNNIEDCQWHTFRIKWDPVTHLLQTYFDGTFRLEATIDMVATIFSNDPMVYWGFSGATGGAINLQKFCTALNPGFTSIAANTISCDSSAVTFTNTSQSFAPIANYFWDFADGTTSTAPNPPVHHYAAPGSYNIKLVISGLDGCVSDTLRTTLNLPGQPITSLVTNPVICLGSNYTLPWGTVVTAAGVYRDTLRYISGCDSVRRTVNLTVQTFTSSSSSLLICGQTYTLPWGTVVNSTGTYHDTLRYTTGCDSIRRTVNLLVQPVTIISTSPSICPGGSFTLPWGVTVNTAGIYSDTARYTTGCDSVIRRVNLRVIAAALYSLNVSICSDETYTLPWGTITNTPGIYQDTVRTGIGCDSLVRIVNLTVNPVPFVSVSKSNDVDCMLGIAKLTASGGVKYSWTPAASLNNASIYNPVAAPSADTWYHVKITNDKGCTKQDSIEVKVMTGNIQNGYPVPNAFTPDGDGKNDCFGLQAWGFVSDFNLSIYNRWGQVIFHTRNSSDCWDGTYKGLIQNTGMYIYQVSGKGFCGMISRRGTLALIR